jgi:Fe-S oxidoreductase
MLPGHLDARRLKAQSFVLSEFLAEHAPGWTAPQLRRKALVQPHCHHHSVIGFDAETRLLKAMELDAEMPDAGCCGMAGSFGYEAGERYRVSMAAGERTLLPAVRDAAPDTLILADGFSCRGQIKAGTGRRGLHLAQVLQLAYTEGQLGPAASPPETAVPAAGRGPRHHVRRNLLAGAGAIAAGAGLAAAVRRATR